jgi:hypothetical protein
MTLTESEPIGRQAPVKRCLARRSRTKIEIRNAKIEIRETLPKLAQQAAPLQSQVQTSKLWGV